MSGVWLPVGAIIISLFLVVIFFIKGSIENKETKIYSVLVSLNLVYSILGVAIYIYAMKVGNLYITGVIQSFYLVIMDLMLYYMLRYVIELNNLSKKVTDEMYIKIYSKKEVEDARNRVLNKEPTVIEVIKEIEKECVCPDVNNDACINNSDNNNTFDLNVSNENSNENVFVNINTASKSELMTIKGIGDKKAEKIIEYRTSNKFLKIEDIMNVSGIGEAMFEKIKNYITV